MEAVLNTPAGRISLGTTAVRIGSDTNNKIVLDDALATHVYAEITPAENGYQLTDLNSSQGVLVNGHYLFPHTPQRLQSGDVIAIGTNSLTYETQASKASNHASVAANAQAEATDREIADLPTDVAIPALPKAITKSSPSRPIALPVEAMTPISGEATTFVSPISSPDYTAPASTTPTAPGVVPAYAILPAFPVAPVQGYTLAGTAGYPTAPGFLPTGAASGMLAQPGYPAVSYAPGGYALPGQFQAMAGVPVKTPAAQKREKIVRWVVAIIVVLLLLGASNIGTYAFARATTPKPVVHTPTIPSPQKALQTYCQGIMTGNSEEIYDLLSDEAKVHTSLDDVEKIFDELKLLNGSSSGSLNAQYSNCGFDDIRTTSSLAVATVLLSVTLTIQINVQGQKQSQTTTETGSSLTSLVWEHNQWKIDFTSLLQSQPKLSNVVGVTTSVA